MAGVPRFDLLLLGYRNDLAREQTLKLLGELSGSAQEPVTIDRHATMPHRLFSAIDHDTGLRLVGKLRERGAQVRLLPAAANTEPAIPSRPAPQTARRPLRHLILIFLLLASAALYLKPAAPERSSAPLDSALDLERVVGAINYAVAAPQQHKLNNEAVALSEAGEFAQAAERLRAALKRQPDEPVLRSNLQIVLHNWAVTELRGEQPDAAIGLLEEGLAIDEDPMLLQVLGVAYARKGDWQSAQGALERALALGMTDPTTLIALGDVYREQGNRPGAVEMLQRARAAGAGGVDFDTALSRFERELDAEWGFAELRSAHFQISFESGEDYRAARVVLAGLEDAYFHVGNKLDFYPAERTEVVLYPGEDFHDVTQTPSWTGGIYDGRIKLPVRGLEQPGPLLDRALRHEYAHVAVKALARGRCPVWLNEGVAIWSEENHAGERASWARETLVGSPLFPLKDLAGPFTDLPADRAEIAYAQGYLAVREIVDQFGARRLRELLAALSEGSGIEPVFESIFASGFATFEADLARRVAG